MPPRKKSRRGRPKTEKPPPPDENPFNVTMTEDWRYAIDERILVEYDGDLYRAVIRKRRVASDGIPEYKIHYEKYRKTWDEWIDNREGLPRTKANLKQMVEENKKRTALKNEKKKAKALAIKLKKREKLLKATQKSETKKKKGRSQGKKSSENTPISKPQAPPSSQKQLSNKPNSNSQAVRKKISSKSKNELPKCADKNKKSVLPVEPAPKKQGQSRKRPSTSNIEATQPKRKKNKSTSTDDLNSSIDHGQLKYLEVRSKRGKPDKKKNKKTVKNNLTKKLNNSIPTEPKFKKKRGRKPKKKEVDEKPIDKEGIIQSTKYLKVVLGRLDLSDFKHLKISIYKPTGQLFQNEQNASNTETVKPKIDETLRNSFNKNTSVDTVTNADKPAFNLSTDEEKNNKTINNLMHSNAPNNEVTQPKIDETLRIDLQKNSFNKNTPEGTIITESNKPTLENFTKTKVKEIDENSQLCQPSTSKVAIIQSTDEEKSKSINNSIAPNGSLQIPREYLPIEFPDILLEKLINDEILVNKQDQVVQFPSFENTVASVIKKYIHSKTSLKSQQIAVDMGVIILNYFNAIVFDKIMYPYELRMSARNKGMVQFMKHYRDVMDCPNMFILQHTIRPKKVWSHVCGPTHLLRLFKFIPLNVADLVQTRLRITGITLEHFQDFVCFMADNFQSLFEHESYLSYYDVVPY